VNLRFRPHKKIAGAAKADVAVRVRGRIVQIQRERPGVGAIVPIAAAEKGPACFLDRVPSAFKNACANRSILAYGFLIPLRFQPAAEHFPDLVDLFGPKLVLADSNEFQVVRQTDQNSQNIQFNAYFAQNRRFISFLVGVNHAFQNFQRRGFNLLAQHEPLGLREFVDQRIEPQNQFVGLFKNGQILIH